LQKEKKKVFVFELYMQAPGDCRHSFAIDTNANTTSSTLYNPYFSPFSHPLPRFSVPLLRLWGFQIDSDITSEACLVGLLTFRSVSAMSLFTGYSSSCRGGCRKYTTETNSLSFSMQTICYALCIRYIPSSLTH
jgi:hypothetical protein